jgi:hypothetical protein
MVQINQEFDRLKQKYQPALKLMQQLQMQVQVQNMGMKGTKQFIVKQIDPTFSDLVCDISVSQQPRQPVAQQAPSAMIAGASASGGQDQRRYTVKPGDTLLQNQQPVLWRLQSVHENIQRQSQRRVRRALVIQNGITRVNATLCCFQTMSIQANTFSMPSDRWLGRTATREGVL